MAIASWSHSVDRCPAYPYCRTMEAYGVLDESFDTCFFEQKGSACILKQTVQQQIDATDDQHDLLVRLASAARARLESGLTMMPVLQEVEALAKRHNNLFSMRVDLWKAMIRCAKMAYPFTDVQLDYYEERIEKAAEDLRIVEKTVSEAVRLRALLAHDRTLKQSYALLFDDQLIADINRLVANIVNLRPTLIVGDKGIAKTQIAKFVMGLYGNDPIVISVKGDMMSDELIGKIVHDRERGTFVFQEGMLLTAMRNGLPILLDEINFGDQAIIARLQDILLKKPGETIYLQENNSEPITIAPGFMVFATANEASLRYRHREVLDPAIRDRFDIVIRTYPDLSDNPITGTSRSLLRLALSSAVDAWGSPSAHIDLMFLESFVQLAHVTQYLYAVPAKDVMIDLAEDRMTSVVLEESQPIMTDCITPRTMSNLVFDCAGGNLSDITLNPALVKRTIRSLDQAGSTYNQELADQVWLLLDTGRTGTERSARTGSSAENPFAVLSRNALDALLASDIADTGRPVSPSKAEQTGTIEGGHHREPAVASRADTEKA